MEALHSKDEKSTETKLKGGLQASLCSNSVPPCSSPLGFTNPFSSEEQAVEYLAGILVDAFLDLKKYENNKLKQHE